MVLMLVEYLHNGRQLLVRGEGIGGPFLGRNEGLRAPFFGDGPPPSTSFLKGSSPERATRSALRTGSRMGGSHPPQIADASLLPQRLCGTCQWLRCWLPVCTQTPALPAYEPRRLRQGLVVSLEFLLKDSIGFRRLFMCALPPAIASVHTPTTLDLGVDLRASPPGTAPVGPGDTSHMGQGMARLRYDEYGTYYTTV